MEQHNINCHKKNSNYETFTLSELGINLTDKWYARVKSLHGVARAKYVSFRKDRYTDAIYRIARELCRNPNSTHIVADIAFAKIL
jgi:hypothetical protein